MRAKTLVWTILLVAPAILFDFSGAQSVPQAATSARTPQNRRIPLIFESNRGQAPAQARFIFRGPGFTAYLSAGSVVLSLRSQSTNSVTPNNANSGTLQLSLVGANKSPEVVGEDLKPGKVNYFFGNKPQQWLTNVPTYGKVRYKNVYPGIDLVYNGSQNLLEYAFEVQPGSDVRKIQFDVAGARELKSDAQGDLLLTVGNQQISLHSPVVYQTLNTQRIPIDGTFVVTDSSRFAFNPGHHASGTPAEIDETASLHKGRNERVTGSATGPTEGPALAYATYLGGSGNDQATGLAVDSNGYTYITGYTNSPNFPLATLGTLAENDDHVFVAKLDPSGENLIYADYIGGNNNDYGLALVLDSANEVYLTGSTESSNFPTVNAYQSEQPGPYTGFLTKVSADGSSLLYSTYIGGNISDQPAGLAIDSLGQVHIAGYTQSHNFPVVNAYQATALPNQGGSYGTYGFLTTFSANGSSLVFSTYFAGNNTFGQSSAPYNAVNAIAVDTNGNSYITGGTNTTNFPATSGAYQASNSTQFSSIIGFVSKFDGSGNLDYSTYFYSSSGAAIGMAGIAVDGSGDAYVTGAAYSDGTFPVTTTSICDPSVEQSACGYAFVTKFDPTGSTLVYSTFLGPNNYATPQAIVLDGATDAYVLASTSSSTFQTNNAIEAYASDSDLLLVEIDAAATTQLFSTYFGGSGDDTPADLVLDPNANIYIAGSTNSADLPITQGAFQTQFAGNSNTFIAEITTASVPTVSLTPILLQFSSLSIGSTSSPQQVELRNMSSLPLSITSITTTGDFAESDTCGTGISVAGSCILSVTFTPTAPGARSGAIQVSDNAMGSAQVVNLIGSGIGPYVVLSPTTLSFTGTPVGTSSAAQNVALTNNGTAGLNISSIQTTGDFSQTNNCPSTVTSSCTITVTFTPTVPGTRTGALNIADNASGSPQSVLLSGTGDGPIASMIPASLSFPVTQVGVSSTAQTVTLANQGDTGLNITNIQITGDYSQTNNCPTMLAVSSSCTFNITFTPTVAGSRSGSLAISDNAAGSPQSSTMSGTGSDFSLTGFPNTMSVQPGVTATYTVNVAPLGGTFNSTVQLTCSGAPALTTCSMSSTSATPGSNGVPVTVTITTTGSSAQVRPVTPNQQQPFYAVWMQLPGFGVFGMLAFGPKRRKRNWTVLIVLALLFSTLFLTACAGGTGIAPPKQTTGTTLGTYTVTITGTAGSLQHSVPLTLTVQ